MGILKRDAMTHGLLLIPDDAVATFECESCGETVSEPGMCYSCWKCSQDEWRQEVERELDREEKQ